MEIPEASKVFDMGKPVGAVENVQIATAKAIPETWTAEAMAQLRLNEAQDALKGLSTTDVVGGLASTTLDLVGRMAAFRGSELGKGAEQAAAAAQRWEGRAQKIRAGWEKPAQTELLTAVEEQHIQAISPELHAGRDEGFLGISGVAKDAWRRLEEIPLGFAEARARANATKSAKREQVSRIWTGIGGRLRDMANGVQDVLSSTGMLEKYGARKIVAETAATSATAARTAAEGDFAKAMGPVEDLARGAVARMAEQKSPMARARTEAQLKTDVVNTMK